MTPAVTGALLHDFGTPVNLRDALTGINDHGIGLMIQAVLRTS